MARLLSPARSTTQRECLNSVVRNAFALRRQRRSEGLPLETANNDRWKAVGQFQRRDLDAMENILAAL